MSNIIYKLPKKMLKSHQIVWDLQGLSIRHEGSIL